MPSDAPTPAVAQLVDPAGTDRAVTAREVAAAVESGRFFWLDLQSSGREGLSAFSQALQLPLSRTATHLGANARSAFALHENSVVAVLPAAVDTESTVWLDANYVTVVLTENFLFTAHSAPCAALQRARQTYEALDDDTARSDQAGVLFLVIEDLLVSFRPQLLALDDRLGQIQLGMLDGANSKIHDELVQILGILTDGIQELGWYSHDLEEAAETVGRLPGTIGDAQDRLDRHRQRVTRMRDNGKEIREEAKNALAQYSEVVAGRQAQVLSSLTIVATVFLPLSFITGYFGMNFTTLTGHLQIHLWQFLLLGVTLPIVSAALSLSLIHRLERRYGIRGMSGSPR